MSGDLKNFLRYVIPSMASMLIAGSFSIVDTIFIGQGMGEKSLAALGISWPIIMIFAAVGDMIGSGAAVLISQARGAKQPKEAQAAFTNMVWLIVAAYLLLTLPVFFQLRPILTLIGTTDILMPTAYEYVSWVVASSLVGLAMIAVVAVIRNDGQPVLAMKIEIVGLLMNIFLDWLFIMPLHLGAAGAAWATILSQFASFMIGIIYFLSTKTDLHFSWRCFYPKWKMVRKISVTGFPILGNSIAIAVMLFLHNFQALKYGGEAGLAAYTLLSSMEALGSLLMTGLGTGIQPMASFYHGSGEEKRKAHIGRMGIETAFGIGILLFLFSLALRNLMPSWTGLAGSTAALATHGVVISSSAFLLLGVIRSASYYYQATGRIVQSSILIYGDALFALPCCLFILPLYFGMDGVWAAMPISRVILFIILLLLWKFPSQKLS